MKKIVLTLWLSISLCSLWAQGYETIYDVDGRYWNTLRNTEKSTCVLGYMCGYEETLVFLKALIGIKEDEGENMDKVKVSSEQLIEIMGNGTVGEVVEMVDMIYNDRRNLSIPVPRAITFCRQVMSGFIEKSEVVERLNKLRAMYPNTIED